MKIVKKVEEKIGLLKAITVLIVIGFLLGMVCAIIWRTELSKYNTILDTLLIKNIQTVEQDKQVLFFYLCGIRLRDYLLIWIFSFTILSKGYQMYYLLYQSFLAGFVGATATILYGIEGIVLILSYSIPQGLLYVPVIIMTIIRCYHFNNICHQKITNRNASRFKWISQEIGFFILYAILLIIGCYLESYVSLYLVEKAISF